MPHLKEAKIFEPLWKEWDYQAQKRGVRHTVYSVNGDEYTGEWLDNKKHGEFLVISLTIMWQQLGLGPVMYLVAFTIFV